MATELKYSWLRWIAVLPASILASWIVWIAITFGNRFFSWINGVDSGSFMFRAFIEFSASAAMGAAFVYAGSRVAPSHKKKVAYVLTLLGLLTFGYLLFVAVQAQSNWAIWAGFSSLVGICFVTYSIHSGETTLPP